MLGSEIGFLVPIYERQKIHPPSFSEGCFSVIKNTILALPCVAQPEHSVPLQLFPCKIFLGQKTLDSHATPSVLIAISASSLNLQQGKLDGY